MKSTGGSDAQFSWQSDQYFPGNPNASTLDPSWQELSGCQTVAELRRKLKDFADRQLTAAVANVRYGAQTLESARAGLQSFVDFGWLTAEGVEEALSAAIGPGRTNRAPLEPRGPPAAPLDLPPAVDPAQLAIDLLFAKALKYGEVTVQEINEALPSGFPSEAQRQALYERLREAQIPIVDESGA